MNRLFVSGWQPIASSCAMTNSSGSKMHSWRLPEAEQTWSFHQNSTPTGPTATKHCTLPWIRFQTWDLWTHLSRLSLVRDVLTIWTAFKIYVNIRSFVVLPQQGMYKSKQTRATSWRCYALGETLLRLFLHTADPPKAPPYCARLWPC